MRRKNFFANLILFLFLATIAACGSSGSSSDGNQPDQISSSETPGGVGEVSGIPDWIKGLWQLRDWNSLDIAISHLYIMTITDDAIMFSYDDDCRSSGTIRMQSDTPMWISNEYIIEIMESDCVEDKGLDSYIGNVDFGSFTSSDGAFLIRFSSVSPNLIEYLKISD